MPPTAERLYLDWNATAPVSATAREAAIAALSNLGNASSIHAEGRGARAVVERTRRRLGEIFGVDHEAVTFTSGGTEANAMALAPGTAKEGRRTERLVVSAVEHPAVLAGGRFDPAATTVIPVTGDGIIDLSALEEALAADEIAALVSVMAANNETGV
ncbi:MAG: aminotransferase class V-fold PLP-dependent enzyme, partial [Pseudomonadota bacterium]